MMQQYVDAVIIVCYNRNDQIDIYRKVYDMKVSSYLSGAVRQFSYWFVHGTLGYPILEGIDYLSELDEDSSCMEQAFSIFMNNIELDNEGNVLNYKYCERRAAEYIRGYFEPDYSPDRPFEDWELELHPVSKETYNQ